MAENITPEQAKEWSDFCVDLSGDLMTMFAKTLFTDKAPNERELEIVQEIISEAQHKLVGVSNRMFFVRFPDGVKSSDFE